MITYYNDEAVIGWAKNGGEIISRASTTGWFWRSSDPSEKSNTGVAPEHSTCLVIWIRADVPVRVVVCHNTGLQHTNVQQKKKPRKLKMRMKTRTKMRIKSLACVLFGRSSA